MNEVFKALSDPTRRQILELLKEREMSAGELAQHFDLAKPTLSKHFQVLYEADLIWRDRRGTSLSSERSWSRTHRLGGRLFVLVGLGTSLLGLLGFPLVAVAYLLIGLLSTTLYSVYYSYKVWKDESISKGSMLTGSHDPLDDAEA